MKLFYEFPEYYNGFFMLLICVAVIMQSLNLSSVYAMGRSTNGKRLRIMIEAAILFQLLVEMLLLLEVTYYLRNGERALKVPYLDSFRYVFWGILLFENVYAFIRCGRWQVFLILAAGMVILPDADNLLGQWYPAAYFLSILYLLVRSFSLTVFYNHKRRNQLSGMAIKQAMDMLPSGILVINSSSRIIYMNEQMHMLLFQIMGRLPNDFHKIYWYLLRKTIHSKEEEMILDGKILYNEVDQTYWMFQRKDPKIQEETYYVFVASNITEEWNLMLNLRQQTRNLEKQSRELEIAMSDMEAECREQEIIALKGMFHDVLGQKIALLLRALREKKEPEEELLHEFLDGIPKIEDMVRQKYESEKRLEVLVKTFAGIGVTLKQKGKLPENMDYAVAFTSILHEAATNAVRHGYAKEITVQFIETDSEYSMRITNNGILPEHTMVEGNGIKGMRKKIMYVGGFLMIDRTPEYAVIAIIPKKKPEEDNR